MGLAVVATADLGPDFDIGSRVGSQINVVRQLDSYRYVKAINANATTSAAGGFDALMTFVVSTNTPGSNAAQSLSATFAVVGSGTTAGGDFESQLLSWLSASTSASPAGLGLSSATSPTLSATIAALRSSALGQTF